MRLDVSLMDGLGRITPLNDDLGVAEPGVDITLVEGDDLGNVGRMRRLGLDALCEQIVVQQRRARLHCLFDIDDVWQDVVGDLDQLAGLLGDRGRGRRHRREGMAVIEHLVARQTVARQVAEVHRPLADKGLLRSDRREVVRGHDRFNAGQL